MSNARTLKPKRAHSVSWQPCMCGCGNFYFELLDDCGHAFAEAWLDSADLLRAAESMRNVAAEQTLEPRTTH